MAGIIMLNGLFLIVLLSLWKVFGVESEKIPGHCDINGHTMICHGVIPLSVQTPVRNVELRDFKQKLVINQTTFAGNGWNHITNLTISHISQGQLNSQFGPDCLSTLDNLIELHIHARPVSINGPLGPLANLTLLDLANCATLSSNDFLSIFNSPTTLPVLEKLVLCNTGSENQGLDLSSDFFKHLSKRPIVFIDFGLARINSMNVTALGDFCNNKLTTLLLRGTVLGQILSGTVNEKACNKLELLDMSYLQLQRNDFCSLPIFPVNINITIGNPSGYIILLSGAERIYASHLCDSSKRPKIFLNNTIVDFKPTNVTFNWKYVNLNHNYMQYLDIKIMCNSSSTPVLGTKELSLNSNGLEFVHPSIHYCVFRNVEKLDLSDNKLNEMFIENPTQFKNVFSSLPMLSILNISSNGFGDKTEFNFANNTELEIIDLSRNMLSTFRLKFNRNSFLRLLDISKNKFVELNLEDINALNTLIHDRHRNNFTINLSGNPFNCFGCDQYQTILWIYKNSDHLAAYEETKCWNENHVLVSVTRNLVEHLDELCQRSIRVRNAVIGVSVSAAFLISLFIAITSIRKLRKRKATRLIRASFLDRLREASDGYEFLAFLSYSSDDEGFIGSHVLPPLQETVSRITGIERPLICTGDAHFRVAYPLHTEMVSCLRRSAVVVIVLSDNFLQSDCCQLEFQLAFQQGKPVLLMVKGKVNTELMCPAMNELFRNFARVHWADVDGGLELKCSWDHVGQCLISVGSEGSLWHK